MCGIRKAAEIKSRSVEEDRMTAKGCMVSFRGDQNILKLIMVMA